MRSILCAVVVAIALGIPVGAIAASAQTQYDDLHAEVLELREQATELGQRWTTTGKYLSAAESAAKAGDYDKALAIIREAHQFAELAIKQAKDQEQSWSLAAIN